MLKHHPAANGLPAKVKVAFVHDDSDMLRINHSLVLVDQSFWQIDRSESHDKSSV